MTSRLSLNRAALSLLHDQAYISKSSMESIALRVIRGYKERYQDELKDGATKTVAFEEAVNSNRLLVQRIQNAITTEVVADVKEKYRGERYRWLPSASEIPDPEHQLNYGEVFRLGFGEAPGDRFGCQCGLEIITQDEKLELGDE